MKKKYVFILILAITFTFLGLQLHNKVFACEVDCPSPKEIIDPPVSVGNQLEWTFITTFNSNNMTQIAYQVDGNIAAGECIQGLKGKECENINVKLNGQPTYYYIQTKTQIKNECGEITVKGGPRPSYFVVVPISCYPSENDAYNTTNPEMVTIPPKSEVKLIIRTSQGQNLSYDPGNTVVGKVNDTCRVCPAAVPAIQLEISTFKQFINLGPCKAAVRFDKENNPLPFTKKDLSCPFGISIPDVSDPPIPNDRVLLSVKPEENGEGILMQEQGVPETPEPLTFVQEPVKGQVPVAFKTNLNPTYWTYFPGYGWVLVSY